MAYVIEITNPFDPLKDVRTTELHEELTVMAWLKTRFSEKFVYFERPTICIINGKPVLYKDWETTTIKGQDVVNFVTLAGWVQLAYYLIVALIVAAVVIAVTPKPALPTTGQDTPEGDPVYTLKGEKNQIRLGDPIEVPYGRTRLWPSYAAAPYNKYIDNNQWLYQLFCLGQGEFEIAQVRVEDTPIADFTDVEIEIVPPGSTVTLFPDNVVTSIEVGGIELFGTNEPEAGAVWIEDSPGDDTQDPPIEATGHYAMSDAGPFVVNPTQTVTNRLEFDLSLPKGLYYAADNGGLTSLSVSAVFEARLINDAGTAIGDWFTVASFSKTLATVTPQRFTIAANVASGRYEVRGHRTNGKDTRARAGNTLQWEALRCFLPSTRDYGNVTMLAVKARATNNLNSNSSNRINVIATRKIPVYNAETGVWSDPQPTRSLVWAFCDVFRARYGGRLVDQFLDLQGLAAIDAQYNARGEFFDFVFDQRITVWEAARIICRVGRAVPMLNGSRVIMVRDEIKTIPTAVFNQENIVKGSFSWEIKLFNVDENDGLLIEYTDPDSWKTETVLCVLEDEEGDNPEKFKLQGCTDRTNAYRFGMWMRECSRKMRENIKFSTGMEGHIPSYGDLISVSHDIPRWGGGGLVLGYTGVPPSTGTAPLTLTLSEPVTFTPSVTHKILVRRNNGSVLGPFVAVAGSNPKEVIVTVDEWDDFDFDGEKEFPLFLFGVEDLVGKLCRVVRLAPGDDDTVEISCTNYDETIFENDSATAPAKGETHGHIPTPPARPSVRGLLVTRSANTPNEVIASWQPIAGAQSYFVQLSYDGVAYTDIATTESTTIAFQVLPKFIYVRVAAINTAQGPFAYWTGQAPVEGTNVEIDNGATPNPVTGVTLTPGFGVIWLQWVAPTNTKVKAFHLYVANNDDSNTTRPETPSFSFPASQTSFAHSGLPDAAVRSYWIIVESVGGKFSSEAGPYSATTTNGITLEHLIPGGLAPVEIKTVLPSTGNFRGRMVYLTANDNVGGTFVADKLYRWTSDTTTGKASWTAAVPAVDVTGQLTNDQLQDIAATKISGQLTNAQLQDIAATKISGQLTDAQISAIAAAKIIGTITNDQLADIAAGKITGQLTNAQLQDIAATKISGQLTNAQLQDIATSKLTGTISSTQIADDAITTAKLSAGSITTAKLSAGAITADTIAANAVTAAAISAGSITTTKLAAGAVTANEIGANAITTAKLAAGAVTANELAAGSVVAGKIAANAVTATEIAANSIVSDKLAANSVTATAISAGAITTTKLAAGAVTANEIAANAVTATAISAGAITTGKLAAGAITANEIAANAVTAAAINAGAITTTKLAAGAVTTSELAADAVVAGKIAAGAITATAVGANEIITNAANVRDATITNAKIVNITADKIVTSSLSAISATIGLLRTAASGARTEIEDNQIRVYDDAGTLRVRMGIW